MYHLMLKEHKFVEGAHVQLCTFKSEWRVYATYYVSIDGNPEIGQSIIEYKSFQCETDARACYSALTSYDALSSFVSDVKHTLQNH